jgi:hypothetical protein
MRESSKKITKIYSIETYRQYESKIFCEPSHPESHSTESNAEKN